MGEDGCWKVKNIQNNLKIYIQSGHDYLITMYLFKKISRSKHCKVEERMLGGHSDFDDVLKTFNFELN